MKIFCYRLKILSLPYNFYIADLLLSRFYGKMLANNAVSRIF